MNKFLKTLFAAASLATLSAMPAMAQLYGTVTYMNAGTNNVAATATNTYTGSAIDLRSYNDVAIRFSYKQATAGNSNITVRFARSLDGTTYENIPSIIVFANGTNYVTNIGASSIGTTGFIRPSTIENTNALAVTNLTIEYAIKPQRRFF